ncbi:hypothetical protein RA272_27725, partial [Pseudomonas syringae pv. tagetis]|uniref:hypothetical protein n=1 Tax=Pseudomonas syringae group genomosp. 7 TaxID=251699 RepID=UPI00377018AE
MGWLGVFCVGFWWVFRWVGEWLLCGFGGVLLVVGVFWLGRSMALRAAEVWEKVLQIEPDQIDALYG